MRIEDLKAEVERPEYVGMTEDEIVAALRARTIQPAPAPEPDDRISRLQQLGWPDISADDVRTAKSLPLNDETKK